MRLLWPGEIIYVVRIFLLNFGKDPLQNWFGLIFLGFGGESNPSKVETEVQKGDVIIIPAGVAHRLLDDFSSNFQMVGSYPKGKHPDMCRGKKEEEEKVKAISGLGVVQERSFVWRRRSCFTIRARRCAEIGCHEDWTNAKYIISLGKYFSTYRRIYSFYLALLKYA
jgi:hypothetical protein